MGVISGSHFIGILLPHLYNPGYASAAIYHMLPKVVDSVSNPVEILDVGAVQLIRIWLVDYFS